MSDTARARRTRLSLGTYFVLAARNLMRNWRRTVLTLAALVVAMGALTYLMAFVNGYLVSMRDNFVLVMNGHVQVTAPGYADNRLIENYMADPSRVTDALAADPRVLAWTPRITASGLISVASETTAAAVVGIDTGREPDVSRLQSFLSAGEWLTADDPRGMLLGGDAADILGVELGDKVVVMSQTPEGDIAGEAFRVRGLLESGVAEIDRGLALVPLESAQSWLGLGTGVTEIIVRAVSYEAVDPLADALSSVGGGAEEFEVHRWYTQSPLIEATQSMLDAVYAVMIGVVVAVVLGQLINTMYMSLHDRVREFGLMEALGSARRNLFAMLIGESLILVFAGGAAGYLIALLAVGITGRSGIDLSAYAGALSALNMDTVIRPILDARATAYLLGTIVATAVLAGVLPAWRATRLNPVEAMRQI